MDSNNKCSNCGAPLESSDTHCPLCGQRVSMYRSFVFTKPINFLFLAFFVIAIMGAVLYFAFDGFGMQPTKVEETIKIDTMTSEYAQATNVNYVGNCYVSDQVYINFADALVAFDKEGNEGQIILNEEISNLTTDDNYYYFNQGENSDYYRMNKSNHEKELLLNGAYYVHHIDNLLYYQNDSDGESIHIYNIDAKEDKKVNSERSYNLIVDKDKEVIIYNDVDDAIKVTDFNGNATNITESNVFTYDGEYIYFQQGIYVKRIKIDGSDEEELNKGDYQFINIVDDKLVCLSQESIDIMDKDGSDKQVIHEMDTGYFNVAGDKLIVYEYYNSEMPISIMNLSGQQKPMQLHNQLEGEISF